jgi:hypothetical protein
MVPCWKRSPHLYLDFGYEQGAMSMHLIVLADVG